MALQVFCLTCRWWERTEEGEPEGLCLRNPPQVIVWAGKPQSVWPESLETNWCSEGFDEPT